MIKTSLEFEREFIDTAHEKTGSSISEWLTVLKSAGLSKQQEIITWLKNEHHLNHMQASLLAGIYLNNGKPVYQNKMFLLEMQFVKCEAVRSLYEFVSDRILTVFRDAQLIPKRNYISFAAIREFATLMIRPSNIWLGMNLGAIAFSDDLLRVKLSGLSPNISHMVILNRYNRFDKRIIEYLHLSYNLTHNKKLEIIF
jgi:predicted transport protein